MGKRTTLPATPSTASPPGFLAHVADTRNGLMGGERVGRLPDAGAKGGNSDQVEGLGGGRV